MVIPTHIAEKGSAPSFREREETRSFYTETLLHTESFTHKHFYTQTLSHRDVFHAHTHRRISTQRLLHKNTLTHRRFYTQTLLHTYAFTCRCLFTDAHILSHTNAFTHRRFCTQTQTLFHTDPFTHRRFYTQTLLHTYAFTHGRFYTQTLLHTDAFTHRRFYNQTLLHTDAFPHRPFYTQTLLHTNTFTHRRFHRDFYTETLTKRGTTGWPQLQTKVRKHSCNGNAKKSQKCTRPGSVPWSTHNPMQGIRSLRYKISSAPWCRGWPQLQTQVGKHSRNGNATKCKSTQTKAPYHGIQKNLELRARMLWMIPQ